MRQPASRTFGNRELIPAAWADDGRSDRLFVTNPSIQRLGDRWLMAYKVVTPGYGVERFALCRLDEALAPVAGSATPLSDGIPGITSQVGDPRLLVFRGRLWAVYCHFRLPSLLYLVELDGETLSARGPARPLLLDDRQWQEKNWMLFEHDGELWAVYTIAPHVVLHLDLGGDDGIRCRRAYATSWDVSAYARRHGEPRGGALPVRVGDAFYVFFHSRTFVNPVHARIAPLWHAWRAGLGRPEQWQGPRLAGGDVRSRQATTDWYYAPRRLPWRLAGLMDRYERRFARRRYVAGFYGFEAWPPFAPLTLCPEPVLSPEDEPPPERRDRLSPLNERVVFPGGAAFCPDGRWLVAYGVDDERCALRHLDHADVIGRSRAARRGGRS